MLIYSFNLFIKFKRCFFHFVEHMDDVLRVALLDRAATPAEAKPETPDAPLAEHHPLATPV